MSIPAGSLVSIGSSMPRTDPSEKGKDAVSMASSNANRPGLLGQLSRMIIALLDAPSATRQELLDHGGPSRGPRQEHSLKNHSSEPSRYATDLARGKAYSTRTHSLDNKLSHEPARHRSLTEMAVAPSVIRETTVIKEITDFYLVFLSALVRRQEDVRGVDLREEVRKALESAIGSLHENERWLLPASDWQQTESFLLDIDERLAMGEIAAPGTARVREIYVQVLRRLLANLEERLDDSMVRLLFRLAARDAMQEMENIAVQYSLLDGIPGTHLRQPGPAFRFQGDP
jgi:hypothetical protein